METNLFLICGASKYLNLVRILSSKPSTNRNGNANADQVSVLGFSNELCLSKCFGKYRPPMYTII